MTENCAVCARIQEIQQGTNPYFVHEMKTGYVVLGDYQLIKGYTVFICKTCARELRELSPSHRKEFLWEMSQVAEAVYRAFRPEKLNYELLGSGNAVHMHWHIFPRQKDDAAFPGPFWAVPKEVRYNENVRPSSAELEEMKRSLLRELLLLQEENG